MPASKRYRKLMEDAPIPGGGVRLGLSRDPVKWTTQSRILNGRQFSFEDRPYLHQLYRDVSPEIYLVKGRQTEASEWLVNMLMKNASDHTNTTSLYMSATQEFAHIFSNDRFLDQGLEVSHVWQQLMRPRDHNTRKATLLNGSLIYFHGAHDKYKESRSIPTDFLYLDEMQSQAVEHIGVAISAMGHSRHKRIIGVGTGDYEDTAWYKKWHQGIQHEWDADAQAWIATSGGDPLIHSYHLPQTIVPWITDADIERAYNTALSRNIFIMEIMGWWVTGVKKPITTSMMEALQDQSMSLVRPEEMHTVRNRGPLVAGIDFGGGTRSHTVFWLGQAIDPDIPVFRLRWVQAIDDKSVEVQADGLIRLLELTDPHIAVMDEGGGTRQLQKIEERFDNVHRCHFAPDRNRPLNTEDLHKYNLVKVNRTHMIESVIDLVSRRHAVPTEPLDASDLAMRPEGQAVAGTRYQIPYAEPGLVDWIVPHFTCIYAKSVKTATGHDYLTYDKEPTAVHDALMACLYSYVGFRILQEQSDGGERAIGRFGSGHRRPYR